MSRIGNSTKNADQWVPRAVGGGERLPMGLRGRAMKTVRNSTEMVTAQYCHCIKCHQNAHFKMVHFEEEEGRAQW